jgi:HEAT repeat protein
VDPQDTAEFAALLARAPHEAAGSGRRDELAVLARDGEADGRERLAALLTEYGHPLWEQEVAAFALGCAGDRRAFETLVFLLNHRDPARGATAAHALARLRDPRTGRAAAALATNELRVAYALHPVRLLTALRAPEAVPALTAVLAGLLRRPAAHHEVALACVAGLGSLGDAAARDVLTRAAGRPRLSVAAQAALAALDGAPQNG